MKSQIENLSSLIKETQSSVSLISFDPVYLKIEEQNKNFDSKVVEIKYKIDSQPAFALENEVEEKLKLIDERIKNIETIKEKENLNRTEEIEDINRFTIVKHEASTSEVPIISTNEIPIISATDVPGIKEILQPIDLSLIDNKLSDLEAKLKRKIKLLISKKEKEIVEKEDEAIQNLSETVTKLKEEMQESKAKSKEESKKMEGVQQEIKDIKDIVCTIENRNWNAAPKIYERNEIIDPNKSFQEFKEMLSHK